MKGFHTIILAAAMIAPGFSVSKPSLSQENEKATSSDWKQYAPSAEGWGSVAWGKSVEDLLTAYPKEIERLMKPRKVYRLGRSFFSTIQAKFKKKLSIDGVKYEVDFGFDDANRLNYVSLICPFYAKEETFHAAATKFAELLGEAGIKNEATGKDYSGISFKWKKASIQITIAYSSFKFRPIFVPLGKVTERNIIITAAITDSSCCEMRE